MDTPSFRVELPTGWVVEQNGSYAAKGKGGALLIAQDHPFQSKFFANDEVELREYATRKVLKDMQRTASEFGDSSSDQPRKTPLVGNRQLYERVSTDIDFGGQVSFVCAQFVVVSRGTVTHFIAITPQPGVDSLRKAIQSGKWKL